MDDPRNSPIDLEDAIDMFLSMADDVIGVPLALYQDANLHQGQEEVLGQKCDVCLRAIPARAYRSDGALGI